MTMRPPERFVRCSTIPVLFSWSALAPVFVLSTIFTMFGVQMGLPLVVSTSGAIPEVAGPRATYLAPGDWVGLAEMLAKLEPDARAAPEPERLEAFSSSAAAARLQAAYDGLFA